MEKAKILALLLSFLLTSCYEKYTMDYEHTTNTSKITITAAYTSPTNTTCAPS
mgnify:CR=1 FL=1